MTSRNAGGALVSRVRAELSASFAPDRSLRISLAPGRLDVMGGLTAYTGGLLCQATLDCGAAVAMQARSDRSVQVFSFDLFDQQRPFTLIIPLDALALPLEKLRAEFAESGRGWAAAVVGCLAILHDEKIIDVRDASIAGFNFALLNTIPANAGLAAESAEIVAAMMAIVDELSLRARLDAARLIALCQRVDHELVGRSSEAGDYLGSTAGEADALARVLAQPPFELQAPLQLPAGVRVVAIDSGVRASETDLLARKRARAGALMGHKLILEKMRQMGAAAGRELVGDPTNGYLANLALADYKRFFRPFVPESMKGGPFLLQHHGLAMRGPAIRGASIEPDFNYAVQQATDHHVFDANRTREFVRYIEESHAQTGPARDLLLDKAGHLMYASHMAYFKDAQLAAPDCDVLVDLVRQREHAGFYGARMTDAGSGGAVAVLCKTGDAVDRALDEILTVYAQQTNRTPHLYLPNGPGVWTAGTSIV